VAGYEKSDFFNLKNRFNIGPAIEYNIFDYKAYSRRALRLIYAINFRYTDYIEKTVMDKLHERSYTHGLSILYKDINSWGNVYGNVGLSTHLNDWSLFAFSSGISALISLNHSLSLSISAGCSYINDQIGLKKETLSPEEFLLHEYEVESDFNYYLSIGFTIELGSKQNNVVNPRFDW
jgi:hypothetical protein